MEPYTMVVLGTSRGVLGWLWMVLGGFWVVIGHTGGVQRGF